MHLAQVNISTLQKIKYFKSFPFSPIYRIYIITFLPFNAQLVVNFQGYKYDG